MFSHRFHFLMRDSPTDFTHRSYGAFKGVHLSPLGFAACQSKKFTNTTKSIFSHRIQNTFLLGILPQISQIYTEISCWEKFCEICGFCGRYTRPNICENL